LTGRPLGDAVEYSVLELCKNRAGYEAVPKSRLKLDLRSLEGELKEAGFEPLANAGILLVVRWEDIELSVFESGKLLFKTREMDKARVAMAAFRGAMGWT
jgi:TATA-box binding protein (TBP) (component of TFIID and TFIIIB)